MHSISPAFNDVARVVLWDRHASKAARFRNNYTHYLTAP
jgi:hypothetical protein